MKQDITTYSPSPDSFRVSVLKLFQYKSLIWVFAKRDLKVKYAQTTLGFGWSIFKPLLGLCIYVFFFGFLLDWRTDNIPYPIYVLSGLLGWNLFSYIIINGVSAVHESSDLIKKIYFPKSLLPLSKTVAGLVEALISLILLIPFLFYYEITLSWRFVFLPFIVIFNIMCGLAITFMFAAISVEKRDLLQVLPFIISMAIWFTPVFLSADILPEKFQFIFEFNPIANVIDLWRWLIFDELTFKWHWLITFSLTALFLIFTFHLYTQREHKFADIV
jgi:lipopolysaccharide transport system permease protein